MPNRTSVQTGAGSPLTTTFDAANRPSADSAGGSYASDADGRLTSQPGQRLAWDTLGRLTQVLPASGSTPLATYTYDPLDRLRLVDYGSSRVRFRYVGLTSAVAQTIDDVTGSVVRHVGTGWTGERLLDWTGTGQNERVYGENAHHDVVWTAGSTGAVSATLRYDPWGTLTTSSGSSLPDFRFQGSWFDTTTSLSWVITRWYAPALGRFVSEDSLTGDPVDPPSRHLYAYAAGEPIARWDPDGRAALGTCGGWGCTADTKGRRRQDQWTAFFRRFPGFLVAYSRVSGAQTIRLSGTGRGAAPIAFMDWIRRSGRLEKSPWWNRVNREEVQGSLTAWYRFDQGSRYVRVTSSDSAYLWSLYIQSRRFDPAGSDPLGYYGGTFRQAWDAHQRSLWNGVRAASVYYGREPKAEQLFILKVVANVEIYARTGVNLDVLLDLFRVLGGYPEHYPVTRQEACKATWPSNIFLIGTFVTYRSLLERELCG